MVKINEKKTSFSIYYLETLNAVMLVAAELIIGAHIDATH